VSHIVTNTAIQSLSVADCSVNVMFQVIDITDLAVLHSLLQNDPDCVVNRVSIPGLPLPGIPGLFQYRSGNGNSSNKPD